MTVSDPPRPQPPAEAATRPLERPDSAALREQALIEEARQRARRRRRRLGACGLFAVLLLAGVIAGFARDRGGSAPDAGAPSGTQAGAGPPARNGKIALLAENYLKVVNPDGSGLRTLTGSGGATPKPCIFEGCTISAYAWSPDGKWLAFIRGDAGRGGGCQTNCRPPRLSLFLIGADGGGERRIAGCDTDCGGAYVTGSAGIAWSPDSSSIAFFPRSLSVVDVRTGKIRRLGGGGSSPAWSPDGKTIGYASGAWLYTVNATGTPSPTPLVQLPSLREHANTVDWAPDARQIVFDDNEGIYSVRADGSHLTLLQGNGHNGPGVPSWSPDGTQILYFSTPRVTGGFVAEIWRMKASGAARTLLFHLGCCVAAWYRPIWSPDGKQIAFAADALHGPSGTFVMNTDGTGLRKLLPIPTAISWQPVK